MVDINKKAIYIKFLEVIFLLLDTINGNETFYSNQKHFL